MSVIFGSQARDEAQQLIEKIAVGHGYIEAAKLDAMPADIRRVVEEALKSNSKSHAAATEAVQKLAAGNINVAFELLQNADDNQYTRAKAACANPGVQFIVTQDMVIIGSNEDGFTESNVKSLCDFGKSTKNGILGYIGQSDVGFKSVFTIASKVQVESGPFSFYLQHEDGDSGIGVARPHWTEPPVLPDYVGEHEAYGGLFGNRTRIILFLKDQNRDNLRGSFVNQLWDTPDSVLLFMRNLRSLKITVLGDDNEVQRSKDVLLDRALFGSGTLITTTKMLGPTKLKTWNRYLVYKSTATGLPANPNRRPAPESSANTSSAEIILAFPIDEKFEPTVEIQKAFAFMPVSESGLSFLVHSDFVTDATRQKLVTFSDRNVHLKKAVADAIATAVQDLCKKPGLEHKWMRFLPQINRNSIDPFWLLFDNTLRSQISEVPLLRPRSQKFGSVSKIALLKRLSADQLDQHGAPLLPDLDQEMYLSSGYESEDLDILSQYGLTYMPNWAIISRLEAFTKTGDWRTRVFENRDEDWHSRLASLILKLWNDKQNDWKTAIRGMHLIPLASGDLKQAIINGTKCDFYDNLIEGIPIPGDLDFSMLLPAAAANPDCRKLYEVFGPKTLAVQQVREKIIKLYKDPAEVAKLDMAKSKNHLIFLYRIEPKDFINKDEQEIMVVFDQKLRTKRPKQEYVYLPGDGPVAPGKIFNPPFPDGLEPPDVSLLHPAYLEDPPTPSAGNEKPWTQWLYHIIYCEEKIQLFSVRDPPPEADKTYSQEYQYLVKAWPGLTLHRLMLNFQKPEVKKQWVDDKKGSALMRRMEFLCTDGVRHALQETFLPLPELVENCHKCFASVESMPFLKLDERMKDDEIPAWLALAEHCGIGAEDDTKFTLAMLGSISKTATEMTSDVSQAVTELYLKLESGVPVGSSSATIAVQTQITNFFNDNKCVLCTPLRSSDLKKAARWDNRPSCLWTAPDGINFYKPLRSLWSPVMEKMEPGDSAKLGNFFSQTLAIRDITQHDVVSELGHSSRSLDQKKDYSVVVKELYTILQEQTKNLDEINALIIKQAFRDTSLIYSPHQASKRWYKVSECIWSSEGANQDEISLEPLYPDHSPLFVSFLDVPKMGASLIYQRLLDVENTVQPIPEIKKLFWSLLDGLTANKESSSVFADKIRVRRVFPVKLLSGEVQPMSILGDFCINDRPVYAAALRDKVNFLDFSVEEVHRLEPVIAWLRLTERYLSKSVTEKTSVDESQGVVESALSNDIAGKAAAFSMIAAHFSDGQPTIRSYTLQGTIRKVEVFRHPEIQSSITRYHGFKATTVPLATSGMHFQLTLLANWQFYIPQDDEDRDFCMSTEFPRLLAAQLLGCPVRGVNPEAVMIVASVLRAKLSNVGRILQYYGVSEASALLNDIPEPPHTPERRRDNSAPSPSPSPAHTIIRSPVPAVSSAQVIRDATTPYQALLIQAVNVARISTFPHKNSVFDMTAISQSLAESTARSGLFRFYVGDQTEWQRMVGAAGELYVFELLSTIPHALPGWSRDNWQSTVRHHASIHPDYNSLGNWYGTEQGDLFFDDVTGTFTSYLIEKGYLEDSWRKERPEYYIEVKTTTSGRLDTPFYMSKHQYARMQSFGESVNTATQRRKVYILFRVHGLESGQVGLRVFIDLEALRKSRDLVFEAQSWTVTPRACM
ncbi:hypothetical protein NOF04DRAFT_17789 [Fusarium oxysporum II5]|uniref:Protein NO VEIN C-terminal domain-containing protein n=3 Tax=Fusarium oxysporum species complex TaxID=171631 RepID=X0J5H8_FUSO5|nr:uncharacterized protein FOIG_15311 [Fusarium odoratissimum NRRL 54006]EXL91560.1 hypothetical protein FOIG_15311 [Fusarium odoratissimum NRRL 54006]KAK2133932.1 hypothetical protein NOF04DRAFT_17789 [Fusarium oxysporum II5]TXC07894.1 hypothetical protein FocTR4_00004177 [Fusarium oxysporum f. sp. cubense]